MEIRPAGKITKRPLGFRSLQEVIDTTTSHGKLFFHNMAALAEFERDRNRERTMAGLAAARARGKKGGRPPAPKEKVLKVASLSKNKDLSINDICKILEISRPTYYRYLKLSNDLV